MSHARGSNDRFRLARISLGMSQGALAEAAGVTRQAISGIESGRWSPSLDVALRLAAAVGSTVEELFGAVAQQPVVAARLAGDAHFERASDPGRILLAEREDGFHGFALAGDDAMSAGFQPAAAVTTDASASPVLQVQPLAAPGPVFAVAGCDPALPLLAGPLARHRPPVGLAWRSCGNAAALALLESGAVHAAALHRPVASTPRPRAATREVIGFAAWREGLVVAPRHARRVSGLRDALELGLRIANREPGSEARRLLDQELARIGWSGKDVAGYDTTLSAHLLVASAVASGLAEFAVASEPAAICFGLAFVSWQAELCELHLERDALSSPEVKGLLDVLAGAELPAQVAAISGYDAAPCGRLAT